MNQQHSREEFDFARAEESLSRCGIVIKDTALLLQVFTHKSYVGYGLDKPENNEELEFLGDAVLGLVVGARLLGDGIRTEGKLTKARSLVVNNHRLARISKELGLGELLRLSHGEIKTGGRNKQRILSGCLEALIGALYREQGLEAVERTVDRLIMSGANQLIKDGLNDPKSNLNERTQAKWRKSPKYKVLSEVGLPHDRRYVMAVSVPGGGILGSGEGRSKHEAEEAAASCALERMED